MYHGEIGRRQIVTWLHNAAARAFATAQFADVKFLKRELNTSILSDLTFNNLYDKEISRRNLSIILLMNDYNDKTTEMLNINLYK